MITPHGDQCVVGGGSPSDWCYPCTNYYQPNASDPRNVSDLSHRVAGDDSTFLVQQFERFLLQQLAAHRPWLAHLCFHAIHEPHPAMPDYYRRYSKDPDYSGALEMWDAALGSLLDLLDAHEVAPHTAIFYTTDNGPHQGKERSDIHYSTGFLRQCKASVWEGGIRVPGLVYVPWLVHENKNVSTPATTADFLPTIMGLLQVTSDNPSWVVDGVDLIPLIGASPAQSHGRLQLPGAEPHSAAAAGAAKGGYLPRDVPIGFDCTFGQHALIDNNWKLVHNPGKGQCTFQPPYATWHNLSSVYLLFDIDTDPHELHDLSRSEPAHLARMRKALDAFLASVEHSQANETHCGKFAPSPPTSVELPTSHENECGPSTVCQQSS